MKLSLLALPVFALVKCNVMVFNRCYDNVNVSPLILVVVVNNNTFNNTLAMRARRRQQHWTSSIYDRGWC